MTHVDDLLIAAPEAEIKGLMEGLSGIFPIAEWETDEFEYTRVLRSLRQGERSPSDREAMWTPAWKWWTYHVVVNQKILPMKLRSRTT